MRLTRFIIVLLVLAWTPLSQSADAGAEVVGEVWLVDLEGSVGPASVDLIVRTLDNAAEANATALIIRMNTPGGLDKAMRDLVQAILASPIPVVTYVAPNGARAASAGTYIAYASHVAAMAPATNIGSSTPVSIAPGPTPGAPPAPPSDDDKEPADNPMDAMGRKVVNDAVAYLQSLAELRGRNIEWAEKTVREGANLRASEALEANVIDVIAEDVPALLAAIDGFEVKGSDRPMTLATRGAEVVVIESDWWHDVLETITDPSIAYGLLIIGLYALILEFYNPGLIIPAVTGVILILLGAYGLQLLPVNYAGLALLLLGIALMIAEVVTPTFGVLGIGGLAAFVLGSLILFDTESPDYQLPAGIVAAFAIATGATVFAVVGMAVRARAGRVVSGPEAMVGAHARTTDTFTELDDAYVGEVFAFGEHWQARASEPLEPGQDVLIESLDGLILDVTKEPH